MKKIIELKQKLKSGLNFKHKYDLTNDDKIHLLYVCPRFDAKGYYRMIAQAMEINNTETHKSLITNIDNSNFESMSELTTILDERLLYWADFIIFPPIFSDITYLLKALHAYNPTLQIVFNVDQNYFALNELSYGNSKIPISKLQSLEHNLAEADRLLVGNLQFKNFLQRFITLRHPSTNVRVDYIPNLISKIGYEEMPKIQKNTSEKFRVGLIKPTFEDLNFVKNLLAKLEPKLKSNIQLVCLGNSVNFDLIKQIGLQDIELHKTVSFKDYFEKLNALKLDTVLLYGKDSTYNKHHHSYLFLELSAFGIPTITSIYHPAKKYIEDGVNGIVAAEEPEWIQALDLLINVDGIRDEIGNKAIKAVWKYFSYTRKQLLELTEEIFF